MLQNLMIFRLIPLILVALMLPGTAHAQRVSQLPTIQKQAPAPQPVQVPAKPPVAAPTEQRPEQRLQIPAPATGGKAAGANGPQTIERIVAIVNDDVITSSELNDRMGLAYFSSGLPQTQENNQRLMPQVLRSMVDEQLQRQEAKRSNITVDKKDVAEAIQSLARDNRIPPDQVKEFLASHGVNIRTLEQQVEASIMWSKVIQRRLRPLVEVGDEEVDERIARIRANAGKPEYLVAEIFLRVDDPNDEPQVAAFAQRVIDQIKSGANFAALAQQFSQGVGALQGGDMGWIQGGQLSPELDRTLLGMSKGQLSDPVRSSAGYHILLVRDQRNSAGSDPSQIEVKLSQISVPRTDGMSNEALVASAKKAHDAAKSCATLASDVATVVPSARVAELEKKPLGDLPPWLATLVQSLREGQVSDPLDTQGGAAMVMVCERTDREGGGPSRDAVLNQIGTERLEIQARRLLRDLRREATVEIRL